MVTPCRWWFRLMARADLALGLAGQRVHQRVPVIVLPCRSLGVIRVQYFSARRRISGACVASRSGEATTTEC